jgi:hypothetical protein
MPATDNTATKLIDLLQQLGVEPGIPISLYKIGPPMIDQGISQDSIVNALYALKERGVIDLPGNNSLVLLEERSNRLD